MDAIQELNEVIKQRDRLIEEVKRLELASNTTVSDSLDKVKEAHAKIEDIKKEVIPYLDITIKAKRAESCESLIQETKLLIK